MGRTSYDNAVLAQSSLVAYWTLDGNTNDSKGTNHMSGGTAGSYIDGPDGGRAMQFNGTTQAISTASTVDLTGTNKVTLMAWLMFVAYDLVNTVVVAESSVNSGANAGSFALNQDGASAGDPVRTFCRGNVGNSSAEYKDANYLWSSNLTRWYHLAAIYDFSLPTNEVNMYLNGSLATAQSRVANSNNTASFGNFTIFLGGRNNSSLFCNCALSRVAVFNTALSAASVLSLYQTAVSGIIPSIPSIPDMNVPSQI